jgi:hypothetical protein
VAIKVTFSKDYSGHKQKITPIPRVGGVRKTGNSNTVEFAANEQP